MPVSWHPVEELPVLAANAFSIVITPRLDLGPGEFVLNVGYLVPPVLSGTTTEELVAQAQLISGVDVKPVVRLSFSRERAIELRDALNRVLQALGSQ